MFKGNPVTGIRYLIRGFKLLSQPQIRPFVVVPLLINALIFAVLIYFSLDYVGGWIDSLVNWIPDWLSFLSGILWTLAVIAILIAGGYIFSTVAIIIASPFNSLLAEKAEELVTGQPVDGLETFAAALATFPRSIVREIRKLFYQLPWLLGVLVLSFIPPFTLISPMLWFMFGAWMMSVQYYDYPSDNHEQSFTQMVNDLGKKRLTSYGFGGVVSLISAIPIVNFIVVPAAICGAVIYWCEELQE